MKRIATICLLCLAAFSMFGRERSEFPASAETGKELFSVSLSYYGETFVHPGMTLGVEIPILGDRGHSFFGLAELGSYVHPRSHFPVFLTASAGYRYQLPFGLNFTASVGAGYFHKFLPGNVYSRIDGQITAVSDSGRGKFMPTMALGIGWDLESTLQFPIDLFFRTHIFGEYPVNTNIIPRFAGQAGVRVKL